MLDETLLKIEETVKSAGTLDRKRQQELLGLIGKLRSEVTDLSRTHGDQAQSIAGFAQVSSYEATRETPDSRLVELSLEGLKSSVEQFEVTHPKLVSIVNAIHQAFANIGLS
jgi:Mg2+ and Co2+ transporter CorA